MACFPLSNSAVKVHDSREFRNMEMKKEGTGFTFALTDMLPSLQIDFCFIRVTVACSSLERTSSFEPLWETATPKYLKLVTVPSFALLP